MVCIAPCPWCYIQEIGMLFFKFLLGLSLWKDSCLQVIVAAVMGRKIGKMHPQHLQWLLLQNTPVRITAVVWRNWLGDPYIFFFENNPVFSLFLCAQVWDIDTQSGRSLFPELLSLALFSPSPSCSQLGVNPSDLSQYAWLYLLQPEPFFLCPAAMHTHSVTDSVFVHSLFTPK